MNTSLSRVTGFALCWVALAVEASPILTAICEPPEGPRVDYVPNVEKLNPVEGRDRFNEVRPTFVVDDSKDGVITMIWGPTVVPGLPKEVVPPTTAQDIKLVQANEDQITAIEPYGSGVYTYALFPKLGFGIFTRMSYSGGGATGYMMFAKCRFAT